MKIFSCLSYFELDSCKLREGILNRDDFFQSLSIHATFFSNKLKFPWGILFQFLVLVLHVGLQLQLQAWPTGASDSLEPQ